MPDRRTKMGATPLERPRPDRQGREGYNQHYDPEQVYVMVDLDAKVWQDADGREHKPRRFIISGWVGYGVPASMALTESQLVGLTALCQQALSESVRWREAFRDEPEEGLM